MNESIGRAWTQSISILIIIIIQNNYYKIWLGRAPMTEKNPFIKQAGRMYWKYTKSDY